MIIFYLYMKIIILIVDKLLIKHLFKRAQKLMKIL